MVLQLQKRVSMQSLADSVTSPASPRYMHPYTTEEIRDLAGPSLEDYNNLLAKLRDQGLKVVGESKTRLYVTVRGDHDTIGKLFNTEVKFTRTDLSEHTVAKSAVVPTDLSLVESVAGLDNTHHRRPWYHLVADASKKKPKPAPKPVPKSGKKPKPAPSSPTGELPSKIRSLYGFDAVASAGINGSGQHIAIATYNSFHVSEVNSYYAQMNISPAPTVDQINVSGTATYDENSALETNTDAELSGMIAPGAAIHVFTSADNSDAGELALFTSILDDGRAQVVNYSWGGCETDMSASHLSDMEPVFARAVAQGVNIMAASGDSGSNGCPTSNSTTATWPSADQNVVSVGGTTITDSTALAQSAWNGSGGGISTLISLPDYQQSLGRDYSMRSFPDVSFNADPNSGEPVWGSNNGTPQWVQIGGTSVAAPQWTGFLALVGQARSGKALGFLNPIIYGLDDSQRSSLFSDVTTGSNGAYSAARGWDPVTGWGTMQADNLLNYLVGI